VILNIKCPVQTSKQVKQKICKMHGHLRPTHEPWTLNELHQKNIPHIQTQQNKKKLSIK